MAEREGFDLLHFSKISQALCLRIKSKNTRELDRLIDVLFLHDFLPSRDAFQGQFKGNASSSQG